MKWLVYDATTRKSEVIEGPDPADKFADMGRFVTQPIYADCDVIPLTSAVKASLINVIFEDLKTFLLTGKVPPD